MRRWAGRLGAAAAGLVAALAVTGVAYAHTEVEIEPAVAGSTNAVMTVNAAAESNSAGVASIRVVLPAGIPPSSVTLRSGPTGWTLTPTEDGYSVGGPALPVGENAVHAVTVARLPDETRIVIKTLVNYTDGSVDRWIEEPTTANPQPQNPAPVVTLAPNPTPQPATSAPATSAPATTAPASSPSPAALEPADGDNTWVWWVVAAIVIVGSVTAAALVFRRGTNRA